MFKAVLTCIFIILSGWQLTSAEEFEPRNGLHLGISSNKINTESDTFERRNPDNLLRPTIGYYRDLVAIDDFTLRGGANFSTRGIRLQGGQIRNMLHYIDFPMDFRLESFFLNVMAEVKPSLRIHAHQYHHEHSSTFSDYEPLPNSHRVDLNLGAGVEMPIWENLDLTFKYFRGMTSVNQVEEKEKMTHSSFEFGVNIDLTDRSLGALLTSQEDTMGEHHINQLAEGVLLVRIQDRKGTIERLEERDQYEEIEEIKERVEKRREEIIEAFSENFDFTDVLFFHASNSGEIKVRNFENTFSADDEQENGSFIIGERPIYIAEFGEISPDDPSTSIDGLLIMDQYFSPLNTSMPSRVNKYAPITQEERSEKEMVEELDSSLQEYYEEVQRTASP